MADVAVPSIATATPAAADTVVGVQGGAVKRFAISGLPFTQAGTGAVARTAIAKMQESVSVADFGAVGDGATDNAAAFASADAAPGIVLVLPGRYAIASNLTLSASYCFLVGAVLVPASGVVVTMNGHIDAGAYQIFDISEGGSFAGTPAVERSFVEWFGVASDGTDQLSKLDAALAFVVNGGVPALVSRITGTVVISALFDIEAPWVTIDLPMTIKLVEAATEAEAVRLSGDALHVRRLIVDRNRAGSTWDGVNGTQPAVRFGTGVGMRVDYLQCDNSMDEGLSIQLSKHLTIGTLVINDAGEHGIYVSGSPSNILIENLRIDGFGLAGNHSSVAAIKLSGTSPARISGFKVLAGTVNDGGATPGVAKSLIENGNSADIDINLRVEAIDRVFNVNGGTDGSYSHRYQLACDVAREYICGAGNTGVTRGFVLDKCRFPSAAFLKANIWERMIDCEIPGGLQIDSGHDANISGKLELVNVNTAQVIVAKDLQLIARNSEFTNLTVNNSATLAATLDGCNVVPASNDAINATAGAGGEITAINSAMTAPRYGINGAVTVHTINSAVTGTSGATVNGGVVNSVA